MFSNTRIMRSCRRFSYGRCGIQRCLSIFIIGLVLFSIYLCLRFGTHLKTVSDTSQPSAVVETQDLELDRKLSRIRQSQVPKKQVTLKDNFYVVTAVSSREFEWLLTFIDSLTTYNGELELLLWSLDLRECEFNYLKNLNTPFRIHLHHFLYHFYPLHIRSYHITAIKPIIVELAALTFGEVFWIEPSDTATKQPLPLGSIVDKLNDRGIIVASSSQPSHKQCSTIAIGVNMLRYRNFIATWADCARKWLCIAQVLNNTKPQPGVDMLFETRRKAMKIPCVVIESSLGKNVDVEPFSISKNWQTNTRELCQPHKACVLTGSHRTQGCLTPQLGRLRRNKEKYTSRHGYTYIEETFGFHKFAPCHRVWDKVHAILKYLGDCKLLFWVDTDAVFTDMNKTLESFIDPHPDKELVLSWPKTDRMLNAGVLLLRSTPSVREFFINITSGKAWTADWCSRDKFEQAAIRDQIDSGTMNGKFVMERSSTFLQTLCSFYDRECVVTEKDFIAHFAPPNCPALANLIKKFLDRYPQFTD